MARLIAQSFFPFFFFRFRSAWIDDPASSRFLRSIAVEEIFKENKRSSLNFFDGVQDFV